MAVVFLAVGCNKSKDCKCLTIQQFQGQEPLVSDTYLHIDKGDCSDNDITQTASMMGESYTQTIRCDEI